MIQKSYDNTPSLYIVPTPIGNMEDITLRALKILKQVDIVFAEDTRQTRQLLNYHGINKKLISSHLYNENQNVDKEINFLKEGKNIALVSDRGTPLISDPGYILVKEAIKNNFNVIALPGPTAFVPAIIMSGLGDGPFTFYGFLNSKESKRKKELEKLKEQKETLIFYEAPHRIEKCLKNIKEILGDRKSSIVREISKKYEEVIRGTVSELIEKSDTLKGEIVLIVAGNKEEKEFSNISIIEHINIYLKEGDTSKEAIKKVAKERNISKSEVYKEYHQK
ncbi:MAG: 16S rRNA (cytidine(1402)-2'-O)-methyltransferase [Bacilli bacterium]|nr:16S rRNA (cytidine(1402)-2'-O)-methyltransferase [Bacilli bacterium]